MSLCENFWSRKIRSTPSWVAPLLVAAFVLTPVLALGQQVDADVGIDDEGEWISPIKKARDAWERWPPSEDFKITLEYRNYISFEDSGRGDDRTSINEGRLRVEYDRDVGENKRLYIDTLVVVDDDDYTHGFVNDFEDDDLQRNYLNFTEAFLDIYFTDFDLRLGKQIVTWGKADVVNPTNNVNPTDYTNFLDDEYMGVVAASLSYYWNDWNLQVVGVPGFTPSRLPPQGTRFSMLPPDGIVVIDDPLLPFPLPIPIEDPELPSNSIDNSQYGLRLETTRNGWDFSISFYDGINDLPAPTLRSVDLGFPVPIPEAIVPVYNKYRAFGGDFATTFDRWGLHGEAAYIVFDGDREDSSVQFVLGIDYTRSDIIFDHDIFVIIEYVGEEITKEGEGFDTGVSISRALVNALAGNITYDFTEYTKLELRGLVDFYQGNDYFFQSQLVHQVSDEFEVTVGLDILGGPRDTFFGGFKDNDRLFVKLKYAF